MYFQGFWLPSVLPGTILTRESNTGKARISGFANSGQCPTAPSPKIGGEGAGGTRQVPSAKTEGQKMEGLQMAQHLKTELETYNANKERLVAESEGKYVLIHDQQISGVWDTYEDALKAGYDAYGLEPFLVKRILAIEKVHGFTRDISECPSSQSR